MPYLGKLDGDHVIPPHVPDDTRVRCTACGEEMTVVRAHERDGAFVSRHFSHLGNNSGSDSGEKGKGDGGCSGESAAHQRMKSIAYSKFQDEFPDAEIQLEAELAGRRPDVLVTFPKTKPPYGDGIAVEAQYRNLDKDIDAVSNHYFEQSYSVAWLEEDDFTGHDVDLSGIWTLWPYTIPDRAGTEGYDDVVRWLLQAKHPSVEIEVPVPAAYWSIDGQWTTIAKRKVNTRASIQLAKAPTGSITLKLTKSGGLYRLNQELVGVQVYPDDVAKLRAFASRLERVAFGDGRPPPEDCDPKWHDLATIWLTGSENVTAWLTATLPSPTSDVVLQIGKKRHGESTSVSTKTKSYTLDSIREIADLLETVFKVEAGEEVLSFADTFH